MKPGDLRMFRNGRNPITKEINWVMGLIVEIHEDHDPTCNSCKVLMRDDMIKWLNPHGSRGISDED